MDRRDRVILNSFATECFRDVADKDYISARTHYRLGLIPHFQWSALQAIEKYLKVILLYNKVSAKGLSHNISEALRRVYEIPDFDIELTSPELRLIEHINNNAQNRYLEQSSYTRGEELLDLDTTVWSLRRYCKVLNYDIKNTKGESVNLLEQELKHIGSESYKRDPHKFHLVGGFLESVLQRNKKDELRKMLVWKNFMYGSRSKRSIKNFSYWSTSHTPPHIRDPERYPVLSEFVDFPHRIKKLMKQ